MILSPGDCPSRLGLPVVCSRLRSDKFFSFVLPPAFAPLVALDSTHCLQHSNEVRVASGDSASDKIFSSIHGAIQTIDEVIASLGIESIGIRNPFLSVRLDLYGQRRSLESRSPEGP